MKAEARSQGVLGRNVRSWPIPQPSLQPGYRDMWWVLPIRHTSWPFSQTQAQPLPQPCASELPHFGVPYSKFSKSPFVTCHWSGLAVLFRNGVLSLDLKLRRLHLCFFPLEVFSTFSFMTAVDEILGGAISSRSSGSNAVSVKNGHGVSGRVCRVVVSS